MPNTVAVAFVVGYAKNITAKNKRSFVEQFMQSVKLDRPVLVCASTSGPYALPFVLRPDAATCTERLQGFVPIAVTGYMDFGLADYSSCKVSFTRQ